MLLKAVVTHTLRADEIRCLYKYNVVILYLF